MLVLNNIFAKCFEFLYTAGLYLITPFTEMDSLSFVNPFTGNVVDITFYGVSEFMTFIQTYIPALNGITLLDVFAFVFTAGLLSLLIIRLIDLIVP